MANLLRISKSEFPECYLIGATLYYWSLTATVLNPVAITLLLILGFQRYTKKPITGVVIAGIFILANLFLVFALLSELSEFVVASRNYYVLLGVGSAFLGINLIVAFLMISKYIKAALV